MNKYNQLFVLEHSNMNFIINPLLQSSLVSYNRYFCQNCRTKVMMMLINHFQKFDFTISKYANQFINIKLAPHLSKPIHLSKKIREGMLKNGLVLASHQVVYGASLTPRPLASNAVLIPVHP